MFSLENIAENIDSFREKLLGLLENKNEKYSSISEKREFIENFERGFNGNIHESITKINYI